jgi:hypothetical protein
MQVCQMVYFQIPIWVNFGGPKIGKCRHILWPFGILYGHLGSFMTIWHILCSFGTFFPVLVLCTKKNLATLIKWPVPGRRQKFFWTRFLGTFPFIEMVRFSYNDGSRWQPKRDRFCYSLPYRMNHQRCFIDKGHEHRNLRTRTSMFALVRQTFLAKKTL